VSLTPPQQFIADRRTRMHRLVNEGPERTEQVTLYVTPGAKERLAALAAAWQSSVACVAGEVLEAALSEAWAAWQAREGAKG